MDDDVEITDVNDDDFVEQKLPVRNQDMSSVAVVGKVAEQSSTWLVLRTGAFSLTDCV